MEDDNIQVCIRFRPINERETKSLTNCRSWRVINNTITSTNNEQQYTFDHVFQPCSKTTDVYNIMAEKISCGVVDGYNGTIFAYGQTSSGKTYTMKGCLDEQGIVTMSIHDVFKRIAEYPNREFCVRASYIEIYNENIVDLLQEAKQLETLKIHEDVQRGVYVGNLKEQVTQRPEDAVQLMEQGERLRHFGGTNMNEKSSRSHTIFRLCIESREMIECKNEEPQYGPIRVSTLNLVDLAGSERVSHTLAEGVRLQEGAHINKSLLTLGTVISKLAEGRNGVHIPYRDSKLTRILQTALGGNSRTAIICNVTPAPVHFDETHSTLKFANRAKNITNDAHINEILNDQVIITKMKKENDIWKDKCMELEKKLEQVSNESNNIAAIRKMRDEHGFEMLNQERLLRTQFEQEVIKVQNELSMRYETHLERMHVDLQEVYKKIKEEVKKEFDESLVNIIQEKENAKIEIAELEARILELEAREQKNLLDNDPEQQFLLHQKIEELERENRMLNIKYSRRRANMSNNQVG
ncbi:centromere-associated protein CenpE [Acrasis kona]|uniref:Kinesin-like protein n=1 Tax=Acrasis kona TaxID=1008807 RepID=A0AAW2YXY9_9EUKA